MTSTVSSRGQIVVPKELRRKLRLTPGTVLEWREEGESLRIVKKHPPKAGSFIQALRRLGSVAPGPRDQRPVVFDRE